ncbi:MAG: hypothetical protein KAQ83_00920 [Nanoarchaeota archaeon]|nr:hypothetical protein [Nanoarchaeota archaeon]
MIESHLLTEKSGKELARANNYLRRWIAYPDKGSDFDKKQGCLKYTLRIPLIGQVIVPLAIKWLEKKGYDGLFLEENQNIIGHNAFQVHSDNSLHVFSIYIYLQIIGGGALHFNLVYLLQIMLLQKV